VRRRRPTVASAVIHCAIAAIWLVAVVSNAIADARGKR
jgi:hypothetical protein